RKKVTCFTKDKIMKITDGLFHKTFDEIAREYPDIENEHWIVDIGAAKLADTPEAFDVVVMPNLYGDVLSDVAAQITGSVGLAGSANIGDHCSMFEAIHGSAPRRAGQNLANPSGLLHGALLMLVHIGQGEAAERAHNAWLKTIEDGIHTYDIYTEGVSKQKVGTREFADAIVERIGQRPAHLHPATYAKDATMNISARPAGKRAKKLQVGVDIFVDRADGRPDDIAATLQKLGVSGAKLTGISNRGTKVWPNGNPDTFWSDHWSCRFEASNGAFGVKQVAELIGAADRAGLDVVKTEGLYTFDGERGYSLAQGE
ncbi:MAG TPA: isocitrate/isopropylmalate family dehydrogenase, partial [Candidatus Acidoferrum sp.]|nr:isocitrate/isopropylmalate family dehydrogenase [Candidatus Acidoferrum sp.]